MPQSVTISILSITQASEVWYRVAVDGTKTITAGTVFLCDATLGAFSIYLPAASEDPGRIIVVKKVDVSANAVTVDGDGSETIDGVTTKTLASQYDSIFLASDGAGWNVIA